MRLLRAKKGLCNLETVSLATKLSPDKVSNRPKVIVQQLSILSVLITSKVLGW